MRKDNSAFLQLVKRYQSPVRAHVNRFVDRNSDRDVLVNEVFFQIYKSISKYRGESSLASWIQTIATRVGYRHLRRLQSERKRRELLKTIWWKRSSASRPKLLNENSAHDEIRNGLENLNADQRTILTLLYWEGCSIREAARQLEWSESKAKVQAHRARLKLRDYIERQNE